MLAAALLTAAPLAGCGAATSDGLRSHQEGGDEPLTPRALAAVVAEHTGEPSSGQPSTDMEELGEGLTAAVELRYPSPTDAPSDGHLLAVGVGTGLEVFAAGCDALEGEGITGCAETRDGLVFWEGATPEEDPGVLYVLATKDATEVVLSFSGPALTRDPRELDLVISVPDMFAIAADPRVDVTTSRAAIEAGERLEFWTDARD